jgi:predicted Zn-dependent protease
MVLSYFIDYNGSFYVFHGVSDEADFKNFYPIIDRNMATFSKLTDPAKLNVKPRKVVVKSVTRTGTFSDALQSFGVKQAQMNEFALLNNMELTDKVQPGKLIKVIGE